MKITADTNMLVSATFWNGASDKIISKVEANEIELVLSKDILNEYAGVLEYDEIKDKIRDKNLETKQTINKIIAISTIVEPKIRLSVIKDDPDDDRILECAIAGKVDYIVSSNNHLLKLKNYNGIKIVTPQEFLTKLSK